MPQNKAIDNITERKAFE